MDRAKLLKMLATLSAIVVIAGSLTRLIRGDSMSLSEYAQRNPPVSQSGENNSSGSDTLPETDASGSSGMSGENPSASSAGSGSSGTLGNPADGDLSGSPAGSGSSDGENLMTENLQNETSLLTGASLNGTSQLEQRVTLTDDFYYEPLSDHLRRYITGVSYPAVNTEEEAALLAVSYDDLRYVHVLHYDFDGNPAEGELICNEYIAQDLVEIFYELYYNEYQIERMVLIDEYDGDDTASMEDNNTSCFNYRVVEGSESLSKHAYGLAIDINPFYNPYVTYEKDGTEKVSPVAALGYADRSVNFPYKIDEEDLCCRLFKEHGFIWGGNWNSLKDYQHFQKTPK
jgi:hypothetical protein